MSGISPAQEAFPVTIRSLLPFDLPDAVRAFRLSARLVELTLIDSALLGVSLALKIRIGRR